MFDWNGEWSRAGAPIIALATGLCLAVGGVWLESIRHHELPAARPSAIVVLVPAEPPVAGRRHEPRQVVVTLQDRQPVALTSLGAGR